MKNIFKKIFSGEAFYAVLDKCSTILLDIGEEALKQWLGTVIGMRFTKWFTDTLVKRFGSQLVRPLTAIYVIKFGYYFDDNAADNKIKKLERAEDANDEEYYMRTLNDILRKQL